MLSYCIINSHACSPIYLSALTKLDGLISQGVVYDSGLDLVVICIPVTVRGESCKQWFVQHNEMVFSLFTLCHHVYYNSLLLQLIP